MNREPSKLPFWVKGLFLFTAYFLTGFYGLKVGAVSGFASLVWAPTGIALFAVLVGGESLWPFIAAGAFLVNFANGGPPASAALIAFGNTLEAIVGSTLLRRIGFSTKFERMKDAFTFMLVSATAGPFMSATMGVITLWIAGVVKTPMAANTWVSWWLGDVMGAFLITPFLLLWSQKPRLPQTVQEIFERFSLLFVLVFISYLAFPWTHDILGKGIIPPYFIFPFIIWASVRFGPRGATLAVLITAITSLIATALGSVEFSTGILSTDLFKVQKFLLVLSFTGLVLASAVVERNRAAVIFELHRELRKFVDHMITFSAKLGLDGSILLVNRAAQQASGMSFEELLKTNFMEGPWFKFDVEVHARIRDAFRRALEGETITYDERIQIVNGKIIHINFSLAPVRDDQGQISYLLAEGRDITIQKQVEKRFRRVLEAAPDAMVIVNNFGEITLVNAQVMNVFGYSPEELIGKRVEILVPERYRGIHPTHREKYGEDSKTRPMGMGGLELFGLHKDGHEFPAAISLSPMDTDEGKLFITAIRDVTAEKKAEESRVNLAQANEAIRMRDEFFSIASHELKTPLTPLQLFLQIAQRIKSPEERGVFLDGKLSVFLRQIERLVRLIDGLLDISRITAGRLKITPSKMDLNDLVVDIAERYREEAHQKGSTIILNTKGHAPGMWDPMRMEQVVTNLLINAIKYGNGNPIEIFVEKEPGLYIFRIQDQGIGIEPEALPRIFNRFERSSRTTSVHYEGLGLGLFITRQIVEAHGGHVFVTSVLNKGSVFTVELPYQPENRIKESEIREEQEEQKEARNFDRG